MGLTHAANVKLARTSQPTTTRMHVCNCIARYVFVFVYVVEYNSNIELSQAIRLRESGKKIPGTNKVYPCVGMEKICRDYEQEHGLKKNSLVAKTLRGFDDDAVMGSATETQTEHSCRLSIVTKPVPTILFCFILITPIVMSKLVFKTWIKLEGADKKQFFLSGWR